VPSSGIPIGDLELAHAIIVLQILADMNPAVSISQGSDVDADGKIGLAEAVYVLQTLSEVRTAPSPGTECPEGSFLTLSPVSFEAVHSVVPLGNLNPPGHVFPTGHMYMYLKTLPGENAPEVTTLYSPGDLFIKGVRVAEHINAGIRDYSILLQPCESVTLEFGHVSSLEEAIFGDTSSFTGWQRQDTYTTGGETYNIWWKSYGMDVSAGSVLGTVGVMWGSGRLMSESMTPVRPVEPPQIQIDGQITDIFMPLPCSTIMKKERYSTSFWPY